MNKYIFHPTHRQYHFYNHIRNETSPHAPLSISSPISFNFPETPLKIHLKITDLECLKDKRWVSDIVIDAYLQILVYESELNIGTTTCFFGKILNSKKEKEKEKLLEWKSIKELQSGKYDYFFVPHITRSHWILFNVDLKANSIYIFDSMGRKNTQIGYPLKNFLYNLFKREREFKLVAATTVKKQLNYYDCGVFLLAYAEAIANEKPLSEIPNDINQRFMKQRRHEIYQKLREFTKLFD